jgi:uncharacterized protein HemX
MADGEVKVTTTVTPDQPNKSSEARQDGALDVLTKLGQSGPPWAAGLAIVLAALVSFVLALGLNIGGMTTSYINSKADEQKQSMQLQSNQATMQHDSEVRIIDALNDAIRDQGQRIAQLTQENQELKTTVLKLQFQVKELSDKYGVKDYPIVLAPTAEPPGVPTPTSTPLSFTPRATP